jgi:hypothetical protein
VQALLGEKIKIISHLQDRSKEIYKNVDELLTTVNSSEYRERMKKSPSHLLYSALFAGTLYAVCEIGLLPALHDTFIGGLKQIDPFYITSESNVLTFGDFINAEIPYQDKNGRKFTIKLSDIIPAGHLDRLAD